MLLIAGNNKQEIEVFFIIKKKTEQEIISLDSISLYIPISINCNKKNNTMHLI